MRKAVCRCATIHRGFVINGPNKVPRMTNQDDLFLPPQRSISAGAEEISLSDFKFEIILDPVFDNPPPLEEETQFVGSSNQRKLRNSQYQDVIVANSDATFVSRTSVAEKESDAAISRKNDTDPRRLTRWVVTHKAQVNFERLSDFRSIY